MNERVNETNEVDVVVWFVFDCMIIYACVWCVVCGE